MTRIAWVASFTLVMAPLVAWQDPLGPPMTHDPAKPATDTSSIGVGSSLLQIASDDKFFDVAKPPAPEKRSVGRNPFLLPDESRTGKPYSDMLKDMQAQKELEQRRIDDQLRREVTNRAETAQPVFSNPRRDAITALVREMRLSAIMIGADGGTAIIDGYLVKLGDTLLGGDVTLSGVERDKVELTFEGTSLEMRLPAPKAERTETQPSPMAPTIPKGPEGG